MEEGLINKRRNNKCERRRKNMQEGLINKRGNDKCERGQIN